MLWCPVFNLLLRWVHWHFFYQFFTNFLLVLGVACRREKLRNISEQSRWSLCLELLQPFGSLISGGAERTCLHNLGSITGLAYLHAPYFILAVHPSFHETDLDNARWAQLWEFASHGHFVTCFLIAAKKRNFSLFWVFAALRENVEFKGLWLLWECLVDIFNARLKLIAGLQLLVAFLFCDGSAFSALF